MDAQELSDILQTHAAWASGRSEGVRADLAKADLVGADLRGADLTGANLRLAGLRGADLTGANLRLADLREADLRGANLRLADLGEADLREADLRGAELRGAGLWEADLRGAKLNWQSHDIIAELLMRDAGDDIGKRKVAGLILVSRDWCWDRFLAVDDPQREWALSVLRQYVRDGDGAPEALREAKKEEVE
jgi:hypothetical protein